ncbi:hypothetical protein ACJ73_02961, partial [Blastomyces percursus]
MDYIPQDPAANDGITIIWEEGNPTPKVQITNTSIVKAVSRAGAKPKGNTSERGLFAWNRYLG